MPPAQGGESPNLNLPPPVMETGGSSNGTNETDNLEPEKLISSPEVGDSGTKTPVLSNPPAQQIDFSALSGAAAVPIPSPATPSLTVSTPAIADDNDRIEKEWVVKAKQIVNSNRDNPYNQSKEITVFKADYMKKRYNKVIKISE